MEKHKNKSCSTSIIKNRYLGSKKDVGIAANKPSLERLLSVQEKCNLFMKTRSCHSPLMLFGCLVLVAHVGISTGPEYQAKFWCILILWKPLCSGGFLSFCSSFLFIFIQSSVSSINYHLLIDSSHIMGFLGLSWY